MHIGKASIQTKVLIIILLVVLIIAIIGIVSRVQKIQVQKDALTEQVQSQAQANAGLSEAIDNSDDPEWIASVARDKLGLVAPGEIIFENGGAVD